MVNNNAVLVLGIYQFTRVSSGNPVPAPARFIVLLTKVGARWLIAHQH
jgi:hypothetical protein